MDKDDIHKLIQHLFINNHFTGEKEISYLNYEVLLQIILDKIKGGCN